MTRNLQTGFVRVATLLAALIGLIGVERTASAGDEEAKKIFNQRCTACHSFGHGIKVGPDLKGVASRRTMPWILKFVRSSQTVIKSGDTTAMGLFREFKEQRMPDWTDLSEDQIKSIVGWLAANGPEQKEADEFDAALVTATQLDLGRGLFGGDKPLASGGLACSTCHSITTADPKNSGGGTLGPDLTTAYHKYQDRALTLFFKRPCFEREPDSSASRYLAPEESFALKGYLRQASIAAWESKLAASDGSRSRAGLENRGAP
jgi:mono/diheme cytochrome c family protein